MNLVYQCYHIKDGTYTRIYLCMINDITTCVLVLYRIHTKRIKITKNIILAYIIITNITLIINNY